MSKRADGDDVGVVHASPEVQIHNPHGVAQCDPSVIDFSAVAFRIFSTPVVLVHPRQPR